MEREKEYESIREYGLLSANCSSAYMYMDLCVCFFVFAFCINRFGFACVSLSLRCVCNANSVALRFNFRIQVKSNNKLNISQFANRKHNEGGELHLNHHSRERASDSHFRCIIS